MIFIDTNSGKFIIKRANKSEEKLKHAINITEIPEIKVVKINSIRLDEKSFKDNEEYHCNIYEYIEGSNIKNDDNKSVIKAATTLAHFHKNTLNQEIPNPPKEKYYTLVPEKIIKLKKHFQELYTRFLEIEESQLSK